MVNDLDDIGSGFHRDRSKNRQSSGHNWQDDDIDPNPIYSDDEDVTAPLGKGRAASYSGYEDDDVTQVFRGSGTTSNKGTLPVTGCIVAIEGPEEVVGRSYPIYPYGNYVGRSDSMQITIIGDVAISRLKHAQLYYDIESNTFFINRGEATQVPKLNGELVFESRTLKHGDKIQMGKSTFRFIPFCDQDFQWKKLED